MRKTTIFLLSAALTLAIILALAACADDCEKLGHDWGEPNVELTATCASDGKYTLTCRRCGEMEAHVIPATQHKYGDLHQAVAPTCVKDGNFAYYYCADCKQYFDENYRLLGDSADGLTVPATGLHCFVAGEIIKQPTCLEKGLQLYECSTCHKQESRTLNEVEHDYGNLHESVEPSCTHDGNVAYYQCAVCKQFFDSAESPIDSVTLPAREHVWNTASESVRWIWADSYAEFLEDGVKAELHCVNCDAKTQLEATAKKDAARSVEPTYTRVGSYAFTAEATFRGVTFTDGTGRVYDDVPVLPDGRPSEDYLLVGYFDGGDASKLMSWNVEEQAFEIEQAFAASDLWKIATGSGVNFEFGANDVYVVFDAGIDEPPNDLYTVLSVGTDVCVRMEYDCVLLIKLDLSAKIVTLRVKDVTAREQEFWFVPSGDASADESRYKFIKQDDGTFTLTVIIDKDEELAFKFSYCGVEKDCNSFSTNPQIEMKGEVGIRLNKSSGYFQVTAYCTIRVTYNPTTDALTIAVG